MTVPAFNADTIAPLKTRIYWIDYLRGINILGTVILHSFIAYSPFVQGVSMASLINFPYVDPNTTLPYVDLILLLRPLFSMQLMFLLSGYFSWRSLQKRGAFGYIRTRFNRLILPLLAMALLVMPVTYLPMDITFNVTQPHLRLAHLWFLWVLFCFDIMIAVIFSVARTSIERTSAGLHNKTFDRLLISALLIAYLPIAQASAATGGWIVVLGPLMVPVSRLGLYLVYFFAGVLIGSRCISEDVRTKNLLSPLSQIPVKPCLLHLLTASVLLTFIVFRLGIAYFTKFFGVPLAWSICNSLYVFAGLSIIATLIQLSIQFLNKENRVLDNLATDSYAIYLIHYTFVVWLQFLASGAGVADAFKPWLVLLLAIPISWLAADLLRRLPIARTLLTAG